MKYEEFCQHVRKNMYETIYDDSEGREILIIDMLDAYDMMNKAPRKWAGLTDDEIAQAMFKADVIVTGPTQFAFARALEAKLKEKNNA